MQNVYTDVYILSWSVHIAYRHKIKKGSWQKKRPNQGHLRRSWSQCQALYIRQYNILLLIQMERESCSTDDWRLSNHITTSCQGDLPPVNSASLN